MRGCTNAGGMYLLDEKAPDFKIKKTKKKPFHFIGIQTSSRLY